jgi:hypothetical protein
MATVSIASENCMHSFLPLLWRLFCVCFHCHGNGKKVLWKVHRRDTKIDESQPIRDFKGCQKWILKACYNNMKEVMVRKECLVKAW